MRSSKSRSRSKQNRPRSLGNIINRVFDSSGPEGKVRGTPQQIIEKYQLLARDAQLSNDRVAAENFLQHAEHYTRLLSEAQREMAAEQEARQQQFQQSAPQSGYNRDQNRDNRNWRDDRADLGSGDQPDLAEVIDSRGEESALVETPELARREDAPRQDYRAERSNDRQNDRQGDRRNDRGDRNDNRNDNRRNDRSDERQNDRPNERRNDRGDNRSDNRRDDRNDQRRDERKERGPRPPRAERTYDEKPAEAVAVVETVTIEPVKVELAQPAPVKVEAPKPVAVEAAAEAVQPAAKPARAPRQAAVAAPAPAAAEGEEPKPKAKRTRKPKVEGEVAALQDPRDA